MDAETAEATTASCRASARAATLIRRHCCASQDDSRKEMIMTLQAGDKLMSLADVSEMLGVPVHTLYRWRYMGDGPVGYRVGRHVRYRREAVEAWLEQRVDQR
jgi:excisionase family DNA binding protein